jgi:BirA family biotin operon repressor/biotin-[acetyl-CoA-carboxylase] ligase
MTAAVAMARYIKERYAVDARTKWPNDVLIDGRKAAGILSEYRAVGDRFVWLALGMGVNVNNNAPMDGTTTLSAAFGRPIDRRDLLRGWLQMMAALSAEKDRGMGAWWRLSVDRGSRRRYRSESRGEIEGFVDGVDRLGRLRLSRPGGRTIRLTPGDDFETVAMED